MAPLVFEILRAASITLLVLGAVSVVYNLGYAAGIKSTYKKGK